HPATARQYTDFGLMTANEDLCADVNEVFKQLTGLGRAGKMKHVWQSPFTLHRNIIAAIRGEAKLAAEGKPARIIAKMNSLLEPRIIEELYAASAAGVRIALIVRGVCALKPGIAGLSENIRVRSIIGRFLEHSRVFYFANGGADDVYLASADWMDRNFFRRIELCFPVLDPALKRRVIREGLMPYLDDNCQAWVMGPEGRYERLKPHRGHVDLLARQRIADVAQQAAPVARGHRHVDRVAALAFPPIGLDQALGLPLGQSLQAGAILAVHRDAPAARDEAADRIRRHRL